eukprot:gene14061-18863_t
MGNGIVKEIGLPDLASFQILTEEYDKWKSVGLSPDEMHTILAKRVTNSGGTIVNVTSTTFSAPASTTSSSASAAVAPMKEIIHAPQPKKIPSPLVLLIDDSPVAAKVASKVLKDSKFEVVCGNSAQMGYDILMSRCHDIELIFLDVVMPNVDGVECLGWIKDNPEVSQIPVYMLSGLDDEMLGDLCVEKGAEGMLLKPLNKALVQSIMKAHSIVTPDDENPPKEAITTNVPQFVNSTKSPTARTPKIKPVSTESNQPQVTATVQSSPIKKEVNNATTTVAMIGSKKDITDTLVPEKSQFSAFKLIDSELTEISFPKLKINNKTAPKIIFAFLPTIYWGDLYTENGFMKELLRLSVRINSSNKVIPIICICPDLPFATQAAKKRFNLPFTIVTDNTLTISQNLIGTVNIGQKMAENFIMNDNNSKNDDKHKQNSCMGPRLGLVFVNNQRTVLNRWVCEIADKGISNMFNEEKIFQWIIADEKSVFNTDDDDDDENDDKNKNKSNINIPKKSEKNRNILVVDDSSVSSRVACKKLEKLGFVVVCAYNGQLAFDIISKTPTKFGIILVDVVMPVCDGMELLRMIKAEDNMKSIPIVMLSGLESMDLTQTCLSLGAIDVMKKPFDEAKFQEILSKL